MSSSAPSAEPNSTPEAPSNRRRINWRTLAPAIQPFYQPTPSADNPSVRKFEPRQARSVLQYRENIPLSASSAAVGTSAGKRKTRKYKKQRKTRKHRKQRK
jgi:hypothetical protein